ncbi:hypothetical protein [Corallococcus sicarius]|uniref:Kazal-like domain-containing protein n=1 Tax=Corallococcus sicarius TaxID=2316726 RepID=A0A3A8MHD4_9BACT|nr:hypothetical protein [Corallococcus sicarius]RKH31563.1 hypothetical protein D7X12_38360 [Corallococcus sicarius]
MRTLMRSLLSVSAVLSLAPSIAFAYPPQCDETCMWLTCDSGCYEGTYRTTCEAAGYCFEPAPGSQVTTASVSEAEARQSEAAAPVCGGAHPDTEQTASAES